MQLATVAATTWPITFAMVLGAMVRSYALYKAERGTKLSTLESLLASQTLGSTALTLSEPSLISLSIILLLAAWAFSPIGGQAVVRSVHLRLFNENTPLELVYFPTPNISELSFGSILTSSSDSATYLATINAVLLSSLYDSSTALIHSNGSSSNNSLYSQYVRTLGSNIAASVTTQKDHWGNPRVPFLHLLANYDASHPEQWVDVPDDQVAPYQSLLGVAIRRIPETVGNATATVGSTYLYLKCSGRWENRTTWVANHNKTSADFSSANTTNPAPGQSRTFKSPLKLPYSDDIIKQPYAINLNYYTNAYRGTLPRPVDGSSLVEGFWGTLVHFAHTTATTCDVHSAVVDVEVRCVKASVDTVVSCRSARVRAAPGQDTASNITMFSDAAGNPDWLYMNRYLENLASVGVTQHPANLGAVAMYLQDPIRGLTNQDGEGEFGMVPGAAAIMGHDGISGPQSIPWDQPFTWSRPGSMYSNATGGRLQSFSAPTYELSGAWLAVYFVSVGVVLLAAVGNIALRWVVRAPDFLGSISALSRDSPYVDSAAAGSSARDGKTQTRLLREKWVRIQDVQPDEANGRIALSDDRSLGSRKLDWARRFE
ncbi:uncharacterized protein E0L32_009003 [Thyridium curvatum]|uniref:Uncharacterized protein n=1 Tax=Thyridium curvatum TaxID=1093900 RepID=A0A507AJZ6_9PEZI|nr:uncharacterized protein E0L32_009003 [Thyridium curvatum]TPX09812.1 hypothetical protein E0L32_009003 [Thyridium curvatum]